MIAAKFGCILPTGLTDFERIVKTAVECERLGYDSVWVYDHLAPYWKKSGQALECWTTLAAIAARTKSIRLGSLVTNITLRNPALLAKMTSTVDVVSGGRLIVGLGTGDEMSLLELVSHGFKFPPLEERVQRLRETVEILKLLWARDDVSYRGKYYSLTAAKNIPKPQQKPHPPIWVGGKHPRILDLAAESADGWNYWDLSGPAARRKVDYLEKSCKRVRRSLEEITISWAGPLPSTALRSRIDALQAISRHISMQTDDRTKYFIASMGDHVENTVLELFANAANEVR